MKIVLSALLAMVLAACVSVTSPAAPADRYIAQHPDLANGIARAVLAGEIVAGMTEEAVRAVGGEPALRVPYPGSSREVWLIPATRLRLGHYRYHNTPMLRLVFEHGRVITVQRID